MNNNRIKTILTTIITTNGASVNEWKELASIINQSAEEAKVFCVEMKILIKLSKPSEHLIALDLVDYVVDECFLPLHHQVSSKDFITFLLTLLKTKEQPELQFKILSLIKKWGLRFEHQRDVLPNFYETYSALCKNNVVFPDKVESEYFRYLNSDVTGSYRPLISNNNVNNDMNGPSTMNTTNTIYTSNTGNLIGDARPTEVNLPKKKVINKEEENKNNNYGDVCLDLNPDHYPKKFRQFVIDLSTLLNYMVLTNEMIDNADHKQKPVDEGVRELVNTIRELYKNLKLAIENTIDDDNLMAICLGINDDLLQVFQRYSELKANQKPNGFVSSFHTEYSASNLNYRSEPNIQGNKYNNIVIDTGSYSKPKENGPKGNNDLLSFDNEPFQPSKEDKQTHLENKPQQNKPNDSRVKDINDIFDMLGSNK